MAVYFVLLGLLAFLIHWMFAEVALLTPDFLRLPGYANVYLGNWGKRISLAATILGFLGTILAYILIGGQFLHLFLSPIFGGSQIIYTLCYFLLGAFLIYLGIGAISKIEFWGLAIRLVILSFVFIKGFQYFKLDNLLASVPRPVDLFLPYGPLLFSLWGTGLIPEVEEMLGENKILLRKIVPVATLIPLIVYIGFVVVVFGITGQNTSEEAISGLQGYLGGTVINLGILFGIVSTFTAFIAMGLTLQKVFWYDLKIPRKISWAITCFIPLILLGTGLHSFIKMIGFVGGVMLGVDGVLIVLMYLIAKKIRRYSIKFFLISFLLLVFLLGIIYEIIYFLKA